jgi:integrase
MSKPSQIRSRTNDFAAANTVASLCARMVEIAETCSRPSRGGQEQEPVRNPECGYCLVLLMVRHGLRVSEAINLMLSDVDLQAKVMRVKRLKNGVSTTHPLYNGEVKAIKDWMVKRQEFMSGQTSGKQKQQSPERCPKCGTTVRPTVAVQCVPDGSSKYKYW